MEIFQSMETSNLLKFIHEGGVIMYVILGLNVLSSSVISYKLLNYIYVKLTLKRRIAKIINAVMLHGNDLTTRMNLSKEYVHNSVFKMEIGLGLIKTTATLSPLLGLLGTVLGIFQSFQIVASKGLADPSLFAGGISLALITTIGGLIVSIPNYFFYNLIISKYDSLEVSMEEKVLSEIVRKENE
jgi:biopolymer transport protein ExbB